jgi:hypothetical protein
MNLSPLGDIGTEELLTFWLLTLPLCMLLLLCIPDLAELIIPYALEENKNENLNIIQPNNGMKVQ